MNNTNPVVRDALRWLRFSDEDLDAALQLIRGTPPAPRQACWLCQQAAEKALKAALVLEDIDFLYTHDLDALRNLLPKGWTVRDTHNDLSELTEWAVESRYPGDWLEPTYADAIRAESEARLVHDSITAEFKRRGICLSNGDEWRSV